MWNLWLIRSRGNTSISTSSNSVFSQFFQYSIKLRFDGRQDVGELTALRLGQTPQHVGLDLACHVVQPLVNLPALGSKNKDHVATALTKLAARNIPLLEQAGDDMRELVCPDGGVISQLRAASRAAAARATSLPSTPTVQPVPAEAASRPTSANERLKLEDDSTLKEKLERAKAEAQNVRASEASAQRKLADVEAALQQTKKEAERATNEAQRAKADAQAARESEAAAKRKLADAEAARTAAEACQSAAKSKPGFGTRLRGWILQHYP